jgi:hypothetical protein
LDIKWKFKYCKKINVRTGLGASNTAALAFGGFDSSSVSAATEAYNGSSWTTVNSQ